ncbi:hypothetical protein [Mycobacteroides immunogenum]|uniref:hypothetical protein n=1 Tax=Mycobacteroides immunogenum TaxID=83262 RepID=UPI0010397A8C|nr:hypothetical protein [Mycobacteroides immunogenum]
MVEDELHSQVAGYPESLFVLPTGAWLDSDTYFQGRAADKIRVQDRYGRGHDVQLTDHRYCKLELRNDQLELRPSEFVRRALLPAVASLSESYNCTVLNSDAPVIVTRAPRPVHGDKPGGYLSINGVDMRWMVMYDPTTICDALTVDFYMGMSEN